MWLKMGRTQSVSLYLLGDEFKGHTFIAHNAKGFDLQFLFHELIRRSIVIERIYNGAKIMWMKLPEYNTTFNDLINFIPGAQSKFPNTFGLKKFKKGLFPYLFPKTTKFLEKRPAEKYYDPGNMNSGRYAEFKKWYETVKNKLFDYIKERLGYCKSDVMVICGLRVYRESLLKLENYDPLCDVTKAGVAMNVFRANYMIPDTIAVVNDHKDEQCSENVYQVVALHGKARQCENPTRIEQW